MSSRVEVTDTITPWIDGIIAELKKFAAMKINIGILGNTDSELMRIAYVHEFGFTITPRTAKNLAIPLKPSMRGVSPRDVDNTFILEDNGKAFICRNVGKDRFEFLFMLVPSVTIPERSFIRAGYDNNKDRLTAACDKALTEIIGGTKTATQAAEFIGMTAKGLIQEYFDKITPPKSSVTLASMPGKTKPLMVTGQLRSHIDFEVVSG